MGGGPNRKTKGASACEIPPPSFHALARFDSVVVALYASLGGGGGVTLAGCEQKQQA